MRRIIFLSPILAILIYGCTSKLGDDQSVKNTKFKIEATIGSLDDTKAVANAVVRLSWTAGDQLSAINLTTGKTLIGDLTADKTGKSSTFSGTLSGTVSDNDIIALLYPSQHYTSEKNFINANINLSTQGGTSSIPLCVYGILSFRSANIVSASVDFNFLMSYYQINLTDLPVSTALSSIKFTGVGSVSTITINADKNGLTCMPSSGTINILPSSISTSSKGAKTIYFAGSPADANTSRKIIVSTANANYVTEWTSAALNVGRYYNSIVTGFEEYIVFDDPPFESYILANYDTNSDGYITDKEAAAITALDVSGKNITNMKGIEFMTGLKTLNCSNNSLTSLDLSKNIALTDLNTKDNAGLSTLDLSKNVNLISIDCSSCGLSSLNVNSIPGLQTLICNNNKMTELDITNNSALKSLICHTNLLTALNLNKVTSLSILECYNNQLTLLEVFNTNLGSSTESYPIDCSPMSTLLTIKLKTGWQINGINYNRDDNYIPSGTAIQYYDPETETPPVEDL